MALNSDQILEAIADGDTVSPSECKDRSLNALIRRGEIALYESKQGLRYGKPGIASEKLRAVNPMVK